MPATSLQARLYTHTHTYMYINFQAANNYMMTKLVLFFYKQSFEF